MTNEEFREKAQRLGFARYEDLVDALQLIPKTTVLGWWYNRTITPQVEVMLRLLEENQKLIEENQELKKEIKNRPQQ